tara:strand:+ start:1414 stop:3552 length:2139 start_codon:yes stop_codon:yes gene_type:complete
MTGLTFANPDWLWGGIIFVPLLLLRAWSHWHAGKSLPGLVSPRLALQLINGSSRPQRWVVFALRCFAIASTLLALARPQYGFDEVESEIEARNLIIAVDTSRSMLAVDLSPDRLTRAKLAAKDIVLSLPDDRVGLLAFAGRPFLQAPLTIDHEAVLEAIDQLDTEVIPRGGTNLAAAAQLALETFDEAKLTQSSLVIFSDGEDLEGTDEIEMIRMKAVEAGMAIIAVGVGTTDGSVIPELDDRGNPIQGKFIKDQEGQVVRSRLNPNALQSLAERGGVYVHLGGKASLTRVVEQIQKGISTSRDESESRLRPIERFIWPLSAAFICLLLSHFVPLLWLKPKHTQNNLSTLTKSATAITILFLLTAESAGAKDAIMLGHDAYVAEDYDAAIRTYEGALTDKSSAHDKTRLQMGIGAAAFRSGDFERAAEAYGQALLNTTDKLREHALYNLGNTLFRQGEAGLSNTESPDNPDGLQSLSAPTEAMDSTILQWEGAIEHYESALSLNQQNEQAGHNLELVKKRLEELKSQQEQEQEQQEQEQEEKQDENQEENEDQQEQEEKQDGEGDQEKDEEDSSESEENDEDQSEESQESDENEAGDSEKQDQSESEEPSEENSEPEEGEQDDQGDQNQQQPPPNQGEPEQPEAPSQGDLASNPDQPQPQNQTGQMRPEDIKMNPDTGYSPSEARQLLEALADETEVRPVQQPSGTENYKNW